MYLRFFLWAFGLLSTVLSPAQTPLALEDIAGRWYIHYTNFPRWLKGDRTEPHFDYGLGEKNGVKGLTDTVWALKKGRPTILLGFDTPTDGLNRSFIWRGKGLLALLKSHWQFVHTDFEQGWALIQFSKTAFTPSGYDVIARQATLLPQQRQAIMDYMNQHHLPPLTAIRP